MDRVQNSQLGVVIKGGVSLQLDKGNEPCPQLAVLCGDRQWTLFTSLWLGAVIATCSGPCLQQIPSASCGLGTGARRTQSPLQGCDHFLSPLT